MKIQTKIDICWWLALGLTIGMVPVPFFAVLWAQGIHSHPLLPAAVASMVTMIVVLALLMILVEWESFIRKQAREGAERNEKGEGA